MSPGAARPISGRPLAFETFEPRRLLAADLDLAAQTLALDCNGDSIISPHDLTMVVRNLRQHGSRPVDGEPALRSLDTNLDLQLNVQDVFPVLRHVGQRGSSRIDVRDLVVDPAARDLPDARRAALQRSFEAMNTRRREEGLPPADVVRTIDGLARLGRLGDTPAIRELWQAVQADPAADPTPPGDMADAVGMLLRHLPAEPPDGSQDGPMPRNLEEIWRDIMGDMERDGHEPVCDHVRDFLAYLPHPSDPMPDPDAGDGTQPEDPIHDRPIPADPIDPAEVLRIIHDRLENVQADLPDYSAEELAAFLSELARDLEPLIHRLPPPPWMDGEAPVPPPYVEAIEGIHIGWDEAFRADVVSALQKAHELLQAAVDSLADFTADEWHHLVADLTDVLRPILDHFPVGAFGGDPIVLDDGTIGWESDEDGDGTSDGGNAIDDAIGAIPSFWEGWPAERYLAMLPAEWRGLLGMV